MVTELIDLLVLNDLGLDERVDVEELTADVTVVTGRSWLLLDIGALPSG